MFKSYVCGAHITKLQDKSRKGLCRSRDLNIKTGMKQSSRDERNHTRGRVDEVRSSDLALKGGVKQ